MPNQAVYHIIDTDLMKYPTTIQPMDPDEWSTIGDLHGNPVKLLYFMIAMGAVKMEPADYEAYAHYYMQHIPRLKDYNFTKEMLALENKITVVQGARIREAGDDFFDRGRDDTRMASVIDKFKAGGGIFESIGSNHGERFITKMEYAINSAMGISEKGENTFSSDLFRDAILDNNWMSDILDHPQTFGSFIGLQQAIINEFIKPEDLVSVYTRYMRTLKILSYDYPEELDGEPVIYSHAAISKYDICYQTWAMYKDLLPEEQEYYLTRIATSAEYKNTEMLPLIDAINRVLQEKAKAYQVSSLFVDSEGNDKYLSKVLFNNRDNPVDDDIQNIHGHDPEKYGRRISLDNTCGQENRSRNRFVPVNLVYTKSYATPEAALRAKAKRIAAIQAPVQPAATTRPVLIHNANAGRSIPVSVLGKRTLGTLTSAGVENQTPPATPKYGRITIIRHDKPSGKK